MKRSTARPNGQCTVILGDLDYLADPALICRHYDEDWSAWSARAIQALRAGGKVAGRFVSLYARVRGMTEAETLMNLVTLSNEFPNVQLLLHHFDSEAALPALAVCRQRPLLSYVSGESWVQAHIERLASTGRQRLVVQPVDDRGIPDKAADRLAIAEAVYERCAPHGMPRADLYVDALSPSDGALAFPLEVSVETVRMARANGFETIAWPGNAGLGHADRDVVAGDFATRLVKAGLTHAVVALHDSAVLHAIAKANHSR
jgi:5-methyltetrahydrofolate--homocysteine methyltransferase